MKLTTPVEIATSQHNLTPSNPTLLLGSCFAQNIGERLQTLHFQTTVNPHGPLYNPQSLLTVAKSIAGARRYTPHDLYTAGNRYLSLDHNTTFASTDPNELLERLNRALPTTYNTVILTLGTAWIYSLGGRTVANCHKLPANLFTRRRLSYRETLEALVEIRGLFPNAHIILTVSPIRHIKDGLTENAASKAILRAAAQEAVETLQNTSYFPAFEIVTDELRDYRFYAPDMIHPSQQAVDYVFTRFAETYFTSKTHDYIKKLDKVLDALNHRSGDAQSVDYQSFIQRTKQQLDVIAKEYPEVDFSDLFSKFA